MYALWTSNGWLRSWAGSGDDPSLAVDANFAADITFEDSGVVYATNRSGGWVRTRLAGYGLV